MNTRLLTPAQVAELLQVPEKTLTRWRYERRGPRFLKLDTGTVRYRQSDIDAWIQAGVVEVAS